MEALQKLIKNYDWNIQCWDDRYDRGLWAMIAPHPNHTYQVREITDGADIESMVLGDYFLDEGTWLPVTKGKNHSDILNKLNGKVELMIENDLWRDSVYDAFQKIVEEDYQNYGLKIAVENQEKCLLKPLGL